MFSIYLHIICCHLALIFVSVAFSFKTPTIKLKSSSLMSFPCQQSVKCQINELPFKCTAYIKVCYLSVCLQCICNFHQSLSSNIFNLHYYVINLYNKLFQLFLHLHLSFSSQSSSSLSNDSAFIMSITLLNASWLILLSVYLVSHQ